MSTMTINDDRADDALVVDERMKALASIYQLADSVLSGERVSVSITKAAGTSVPAWTTGAEIFINSSAVGPEDFDSIVRMHGLNFHELAHVLYTPRQGTKLAQHCIDNGLMEAFNVLEDQRIESMLTIKYPSTATWLSAAVLRWVVQDVSALGRGYLFVRGRRYLPGELRGLLRQVFERRDLLPAIDRIVDQYRQLVFPTDYDVAMRLISEMQDILNQFQGTVRDPNGHSENHWHTCDKGRPAPVREQRDLRDKMGSESAESKDPESGSPDSGSGSDNESGGDSPDSDNKSDGFDSGSVDSSETTDFGRGASRDSAAVRDTFRKLLEEILDSEEVRDDVRRTQRTMDRATGAEVLSKCHYQELTPDDSYVLIERRLTQILGSLREEADPGWHRREDYGRLNTVRWAIERDPAEAFDRWDEGVADAVDIEAVIMLDVSGSMGMAMWETHNAMWALKRAMDYVEISTTVISYDNRNEILYSNQERATPMVRYDARGGGTHPTAGLNQAMRIFSASQRRHKLLIVLTDGQWAPDFDDFDMTAENYIDRMNDDGVLTCLGFIPAQGQEVDSTSDPGLRNLVQSNRHHCSMAGIATSHALVPFIGDVVTGLIRSRLRAGR